MTGPLAEVDLEAFTVFLATHALALVFGMSVVIGVVFALIRVSAKPQPPLGPEMLGRTGVALTDVSSREGRVRVDGREIRAIAESKIGVGSSIRVLEVDGLIAKVGPAAG